jgi:Cu+-exporting ATPase
MGIDQIVGGAQDHGHAHGHHHGPDHSHGHPHDHEGEHRRLVITTVVVGVLIAGHLVLPWIAPEWAAPFGIPLGLLAALIGGGRIIYQAIEALFEGRIGADIALAIATIAAALVGEFFVAAEVVFIALVGECLEAYAFGRAQRGIQKVFDLRPRHARVVRDGQEVEIRNEDLRIGDRVVVRPGERIAVDGQVIEGRSAVDQSALSGEGLPVDKGPGDPVFAGTINAFGRLDIDARKVGAQTTLGQVIRLLAEAQRRKSPLERTADRYARRFLPAVLLAAAVVFLGTNAGALWDLARGEVLRAPIDVLPMLAVLVVACPCALILATPAAVLAATARLARLGVLVKGGEAIERLAGVDVLAFDKTGTLTEGRPELAEERVFGGHAAEEVLGLAAAAERSSEHPLARLVVQAADASSLPGQAVEAFQAHPGAGVAAQVGGRAVLVGNARLLTEQGIAIDREVETALAACDAAGQTVLLVAIDGQVAGLFGARDRVRREAHDVVHDLKHLGLKDQTILTGDRVPAARAVARKVHLKQVEAELTPTAKAEWIRARQQEGKIVAMIGDGINDAPALAVADVGIALGGVGTDIAAEAGSIVLMGDPLTPLPAAIRLARRTVGVIRQNILWFAFGLNAVAVVLAGLRVLGPVAAAVVHQIGSFLVILNAIRLLGTEGFEQFGLIRAAMRARGAIRSIDPRRIRDGVVAHRRAWATGIALTGLALYALSGLTAIAPDQVGLVQRWGRWDGRLLEPGLHLRWPFPIERIGKERPDQVRVARVGYDRFASGQEAVAWSAAHGERREDAALFLTGDENLLELAGVVEYHPGRAQLGALVFGISNLAQAVEAAADSAFRETVASRPFEAILVAGRAGFEAEVKRRLVERLAAEGIGIVVDRVLLVDAHPPQEVVPAFRDASAALSDAERYRNEALAHVARQEWEAKADAQLERDASASQAFALQSRAEGERDAFADQQRAHAVNPGLTEFRLLWETLGTSLAGRTKLILDPRAGGRRQIWMGGNGPLGPGWPAPLGEPPAIPSGGERPVD